MAATKDTPRETDVLVVGASAAGLATAACLTDQGITCEVLEASDVVACAWRQHYDRLHLHTPRSASALPGLSMPRAWGRYPTRDNVVEYLETYARYHRIVPQFGQCVRQIKSEGDKWLATTADRSWLARDVVIATGNTHRPYRPTWPGQGQYRGDLLHSSEYRNGDRWRGRPVLVVGFGNSACEQALDLLEHGAEPYLSVRSPVNVIPRDLLGHVPVLQLGIVMRHIPTRVADVLAAPLVRLTVGDITKVGLRKLPYGPNTQIARDRHVPMLDIGTMAQVRAGRIGIRPGVESLTSAGVRFVDGTGLDVDAVVLATGYEPALAELLPTWRSVCDDAGRPLVSGEPTALAGLWFCGFFVSPAGMLREIGLEATRIAEFLSDPGSRGPDPG